MRRSFHLALIVYVTFTAAVAAQDSIPSAARPLAGYAEAWSAHDLERIASYFTEDAMYEDVTLGEIQRGKSAIKAFAQATFDLLPGFAIEQRSLLGGERWAAVEWVMTGTDRATGKRFSVRGVSVMELEGGKIRRNSDYWNMADLLRQTGALSQEQGSGSGKEALADTAVSTAEARAWNELDHGVRAAAGANWTTAEPGAVRSPRRKTVQIRTGCWNPRS